MASTSFGGNFYAAYKHLYNPKRVEVMAFRNRPFFKELAKRDGFEGDNYQHGIFYEDPQGGSSDFQTAIANKVTSSASARMQILRAREYQAIQISNEEIAAARSDMGSLLRKKKHETDRVVSEMCRRMDIALHGDGSGILASFTTGGSVATTTVTLDTPQLGVRFSVGQYVQATATRPAAGTAPTLLNAGASAKVTAVSRAATTTTLTLDQNLSTAWPTIGTTTQYFLIRKGDGIGFGSTNLTGGVSGLKAWLPVTAPTNGDNFWGFDRSVDANRLAGIRYAASAGEKYEQTFQLASAEANIQDANPTIILVHPLDFAKYATELGNKVRYQPQESAESGFTTILVSGQSGDLRMMADPQVDPGTFYMLDMDTWFVYHLNALPHLDESDGRPAAREANADAIEIRWRAWYQLVCTAPGYNVVGSFAS